MPLKNRYGFNCQTVNFGKIQEVIPTGYMEVIPGETLNGKVTADVHSAPTLRNINTRVFLDAYTFYVPYRLVWDQWKGFISQQASANVPVVTNLFEKNFESKFTGGAQAGQPAVDNVAFQRRTYNLIMQKFFAKAESEVSSLDNNSIFIAWQRPSTFEVADPAKEVASQNISGLQTVDELRQAFAVDQWTKIRQFYGDRYVDYLRSLGVSTPWTIHEEPEVLAKKHGDWPYRSVPTTDAADPGDPLAFQGGYFKGKVITDIRRKFIPEHGLVGSYIVVRTDPMFRSATAAPWLNHRGVEDFWSPEYEANKQKQYDAILNTGTNVGADKLTRPWYEHMRKGINQNHPIAGSANEKLVMGFTTSGVFSQPQPSNFDNEFNTSVMYDNNHFQVTSDWRLGRRSPLLKHGQMRAIH